MKQNWAYSRLLQDAITNCSKMLKVFAVVLLVTTLVSGKTGTAKFSSGTTANKLVDLNEDNWQLMLNGEWMVEFYAPWCPACKNLAPTWERYAESAASLGVKVAKIDVTTSPSLSGRFFVTALPTIYHVINGDFRQYRGSRDADALLFFVKQKQWEKLEAISSWKKPNTIHMSILSYFFKLSHALKDLNTHLQEEYGLPTWGSYALFAFGTIFVGAALGLLLVCIVDGLYPPKKAARQSFSEYKEREAKQGIEDLAQDDIEDDNGAQEESNAEDEEDDNNEAEEEEEADDDEEEDENVSVIDKNESDEKKKEEVQEVSKKNTQNNAAIGSSSPSEVRKRKPRKD